jgi:energy-coupling factor transporter ATP-binding protein EcfA2
MEKISNKNFIEELVVENVNFSFGFKEILKDINFTLKKGEVVSIVGPSGGGKTTLLHLCSKLLKLDTGRIKNSFLSSTFAFQEPTNYVIDLIQPTTVMLNQISKEGIKCKKCGKKKIGDGSYYPSNWNQPMSRDQLSKNHFK